MRSLFKAGKHYKATFTPCDSPAREPDFISRDEWGHVSSKYWYQDGGCYRESDHWGKVGKSIFNYDGVCINEESICNRNLTVTGFCKKNGFKLNRKYYFFESYWKDGINANKARFKRKDMRKIVRRINRHKRYLLALENNRSLLLLAAKDLFDVILRTSEIDMHSDQKKRILDTTCLIQSNCLDNIYKGLLKAKNERYTSSALLSHKTETNFQKINKLISNL